MAIQRRRFRAAISGIAFLIIVAASRSDARPAVDSMPVPKEARAAILDAFASHDVVFLGEGGHGNPAGHAFRLDLIRDPRFPSTVNDIVVEFGNSRYQAMMDRYIRGEDIPRNQLKHAWQDTTVASPVWDVPMYEDFFRQVRSLNETLPQEGKVRVLLGDAPIDWRLVKTREQLLPFALAKDRTTATIIQTQVLARHRRALVIYGDGHLLGRGISRPPALINLVEHGSITTKVLNVAASRGSLLTVVPDARNWTTPVMMSVAGTVLGSQPLAAFYSPPPAPEWAQLTLADQFDALLYLGPAQSSPPSRIPAELCADRAYMAMRLGRIAIDGGPPGSPLHEVARQMANTVRQTCAATMR